MPTTQEIGGKVIEWMNAPDNFELPDKDEILATPPSEPDTIVIAYEPTGVRGKIISE